MKYLTVMTIFLSLFLQVGCGGSSKPNSEAEKDLVVYQFDFNGSDNDWQVGFADYPSGEESFYELSSQWKQLPAPLDLINGINISGFNHSDDLFMYVKRELSGLKPYTRYSLTFHLQLATNADSGCAGVGGAPGEAVFVKAGATSFEPVANQEINGVLRMNVDHGNQSVGGSDAIVIGNLANTQTDCTDSLYELKDFDSSMLSFEVFTDQKGTLWGLFATDSGFEGITSLYYTSIQIRAEEV